MDIEKSIAAVIYLLATGVPIIWFIRKFTRRGTSKPRPFKSQLLNVTGKLAILFGYYVVLGWIAWLVVDLFEIDYFFAAINYGASMWLMYLLFLSGSMTVLVFAVSWMKGLLAPKR